MAKDKSPLLPLVSILTLLGLIYLSASLPEAKFTLNDQFYFLKRQSLWAILSIVVFLFATKIKLTFLSRFASHFYFASITLLILIFLPAIGHASLGARRWLNLWGWSLQPSEIIKLTSIVFFAKMFSTPAQKSIKYLLVYLVPTLFLIVLEPNLSTAVILFATVTSLYYLSNGNIFSLTSLLLATVAITLVLTLTSPYRSQRLTGSYHQKQITITIGSGGLFGKGLGQSDQKFQFLPKIATDSIFAVIGEELGFVGVTIIIGLYAILITHLFRLSKKLPDPFASLITSGVACWLGFQSLTHLAATAALIPLTGVPLPFISYGGSSLLCLSFAVGLIYNIEKKYYDSQKYPSRRHPPHPRHRTDQTITPRL